MYGKIFDTMYDGTLADDWRALVTFQQLIVLCDSDGFIDMTPSSISRRTGIPIEHIKAGLEVLENPDPYSRTPDEDGCRIKLIDDHKPWGWYIVNHSKYRSLQDKETVREQNRLRKRKQRDKLKKDLCDSSVTNRDKCDNNKKSRHTDTDTDNNKEKINKKENGFIEFYNLYPKKVDKQKALKHWISNNLFNKSDGIIGGLKKQIDQKDERFQREKQFIKSPLGYLNGQCWEDEIILSQQENKITDLDPIITEITQAVSDGVHSRKWSTPIAYTIFRQIQSSEWNGMREKDIKYRVIQLSKTIDKNNLLELPKEQAA